MKLEQFAVSKFRSLMKADEVKLGDLTVLVGPNNEGKSNLLQAMVVGMNELSAPGGRRVSRGRRISRDDGSYDWETDFPRHLQESQPDGRTTMRFDFSLDDDEVQEFEENVGSRLNGFLPISVSFGNGKSTFSVRKQAHSKKLTAKREQIANFVAEHVQVQYIPAIRNAATVSEILRSVARKEMLAAREAPEYEAAIEQLRKAQAPVLEALSETLSDQLKDVLPNVKSVELSFEERVSAFGDLQVIIDDGTSTNLDFKGDGVQSLAGIAVLQHYSDVAAKAKEFILAVEEPESHLHPRAVRSIRDVLLKTASKQQVVVTTHSPLLINRSRVSSNIIVEKSRARTPKNVQELRDVLGVKTSDNLESAEVVLVVEGQEDEIALRAILSSQSELLRNAMESGSLALYPLHGSGKLSYALTLLRDSLAAVHAFLDADKAGFEAGEAALSEGLIQLPDLAYCRLQGASESEFEDFVDPATYKAEFCDQFGVDVDHTWMKQLSRGKWSKRLPTVVGASGKPWSEKDLTQYKAALALAVAASPDNALKSGAQPVIDVLVTSLESKVESRSKT